MGQITFPSQPGLLVTSIDRTTTPNSGAGLAVPAQHVILIGGSAGENSTGSNNIFLGFNAGKNSTASRATIIGEDTAGGGLLTGSGWDGSVIVGAGSLKLIENANNNTAQPKTGIVAVGSNIMPALPGRMGDSVLIGNDLGQLWAIGNATSNRGRNVVIGQKALPTTIDNNSYPFSSCIMIGYAVGSGTAMTLGATNTIAIGDSISWTGANSGPVGDVLVGNSTSVIASSSSSNTALGTSCVIRDAAGQAASNVLIGNAALCNGSANVVIGSATSSPSNTGALSSSRNIVIGGNSALSTNSNANAVGDLQMYGPSMHVPALNTVYFQGLVMMGNGNFNASTPRTLLWGDMSAGNVMLGHTLTAAQRDMKTIGVVNGLKLLNGSTAKAFNPQGGGYFYVVAGVLRWVDQNGVESVLSTGTGQLAAATTAYGNNAGAFAGSLLNAPAAGNPTKWIPIDDNGTIRNIPAW